MTVVERAAVPCIDVHNHLGRWLSHDGGWILQDVDELLATMDACDVETVVNLDGRWGDDLRANLARYDEAHPGRFLTFCHLDWSRLAEPGGLRRGSRPTSRRPQRPARRASRSGRTSVSTHRDAGGELVLPDDPRARRCLCGGRRARAAGPHPHRRPDRVLRPARRAQRAARGARRPAGLVVRGRGAPDVRPTARRAGRTAGALGGNDVHRRARRLRRRGPRARRPDARRTPELPRRRRRPDGRTRPAAASLPTARGAHPDRVLFGTDAFPVQPEDYRLWFRFLETDDECFAYSPGDPIPPQGRWDGVRRGPAGRPARRASIATTRRASSASPDLYPGGASAHDHEGLACAAVRRRDLSDYAVLSVVWGVSFVLVLRVVEAFGWVGAVAFRALIAGSVLMLLAAVTRRRLDFSVGLVAVRRGRRDDGRRSAARAVLRHASDRHRDGGHLRRHDPVVLHGDRAALGPRAHLDRRPRGPGSRSRRHRAAGRASQPSPSRPPSSSAAAGRCSARSPPRSAATTPAPGCSPSGRGR